MDKLRPVMYHRWKTNPDTNKLECGPEQQGFFHGFFNEGEGTFALVEKPNGRMTEVDRSDLRFPDREDERIKKMPPLRVGPEIQVLGGRRGAVPVVEPEEL